MKTNNKGFSLVELIVVIAIMAILAAVAIPTFATFISRANQAADVDFMSGVEYAIELANVAEGKAVTAIQVTYDASNKNAVTTIKYTLEGDTDDLTHVLTSTGTDDASIAIDWNYKLNAPDKCNSGSNDKWSGIWSVIEASQDSDDGDDGDDANGGAGGQTP